MEKVVVGTVIRRIEEIRPWRHPPVQDAEVCEGGEHTAEC